MRKYCVMLIIPLALMACSGLQKPNNTLADPSASAKTQDLYSRMWQLAKKGVMFGHQDDLAYGVGWSAPNGKSDVFAVCADYPAVFGWDLGHLELGSTHNLDSVPFIGMAKFAIMVDSMGGINTFSWHCDNPLTGGSTWDIGTPGVVSSILPGGVKHQEYNLWLDRLADFFSSLLDSKGDAIPVIFRPFHEQSGSWFWWGYNHCASNEFIELWQYTFKYLTETKRVNNLIYSFSTAGIPEHSSEFSDRYPGDEYVDMVGVDLYQMPEQQNSDFASTLTRNLNIITQFAASRGKLPAITEIGFEQIPYPTWWTEVFYPSVKDFSIGYALFWRNAFNRPNHYYAPYPGQASEEDFKAFYSLPETLFLKDIAK